MKTPAASVLRELYYDWLMPDDALSPDDSGYKPTLTNLCKAEEKLVDMLDENGKKYLCEYQRYLSDIHNMELFTTFTYSFRLGARLMLETLDA